METQDTPQTDMFLKKALDHYLQEMQGSAVLRTSPRYPFTGRGRAAFKLLADETRKKHPRIPTLLDEGVEEVLTFMALGSYADHTSFPFGCTTH